MEVTILRIIIGDALRIERDTGTNDLIVIHILCQAD